MQSLKHFSYSALDFALIIKSCRTLVHSVSVCAALSFTESLSVGSSGFDGLDSAVPREPEPELFPFSISASFCS